MKSGQIRLEKELARKVEKLAKDENRSAANMVNRIVAAYFEAREKRK